MKTKWRNILLLPERSSRQEFSASVIMHHLSLPPLLRLAPNPETDPGKKMFYFRLSAVAYKNGAKL